MFDVTRDKLIVLVDYGLKYDQSYAISMLSQLESYINEHKSSAYGIILGISETLFSRAANVYEKFVVGLNYLDKDRSILNSCRMSNAALLRKQKLPLNEDGVFCPLLVLSRYVKP